MLPWPEPKQIDWAPQIHNFYNFFYQLQLFGKGKWVMVANKKKNRVIFKNILVCFWAEESTFSINRKTADRQQRDRWIEYSVTISCMNAY